MNKIVIICSFLFLVGCNGEVAKSPTSQEEKKIYTPTLNQYDAVWNEIISDPLKKLPQERVSYSKLFDGDRDVISEDAKRILKDREDIIAPYNKLAHPNGVCLSGVWKIDEENPFSGEFQKGSESLVIARASSAMNNTKRGENRAFGMAIKLFGTTNKDEILTDPTANFFH